MVSLGHFVVAQNDAESKNDYSNYDHKNEEPPTESN